MYDLHKWVYSSSGKNSAIPHSCLSKSSNGLSYHRVCEAVASRIFNFVWINHGENNTADLVCKYWSSPQIWHMFQAILFYSGDTSDLIKEDEMSLKYQGVEGQL
jgi:hypothetical protein